MEYSIKLSKNDISALKMLFLFLVSIYAQDTYSIKLYFLIVIVFTLKNVISCVIIEQFENHIWLLLFLIFAFTMTTFSFVVGKVSWIEEIKSICYVFIAVDAIYLCMRKPKVFEKGMKMILGVIVISSLYGIIEALVSYNIFEKYYVADYIRGYYGTAQYRIASIFMHPIVCGQIFLIGFWFAYFFCAKTKRIVYLIILCLGIYYTKSRSIWGGLVFSIIFFYFIKLLILFSKHNISKRKLIYIPILMISVYVLYRIGIFDTFINNISERLLAARGSTSQLARQSMSTYTINYIIHDSSVLQAIFGNGMNSSKLWILNSGAFVKAYDAIDNSYLTILYEFGIVGFLMLINLFLKRIIMSISNIYNKNKICNASLMAIISCIIPFYFYDFYGWLPVYVIFIYCIVASNISCYSKEKS